MVYITATSCPLFTDYFRAIGATGFHFGLLGGIPMVMVFMQFLGAFLVNRLPRRKPLFIWLVIASRVVYLPIAFLPLLFPSIDKHALLTMLIALVAVGSILSNFATPLWMGWMADLIPGRVLNRYWGRRQRAMFLIWTLAYLAISAYTFYLKLPIAVAYPILVTIAVLAGIVDILLFIQVIEPPNKLVLDRVALKVLLEPLQDHGYRRFVLFSCVWSACVMFTASFMQLYVLQELGLSQWVTTLIWCVAGVGQAVVSAGWGRVADRHGQRPILTLCVFFKPVIVLVFLLLTKDNVYWLLPLAFGLDSMLNAGNSVASNGYMMKIAPRANRPMFMAAIMGLSGLCGGLASIVGGMFLDLSKGFSMQVFGREWTHFHLVFLIGFVLRVACVPLVQGIREPKSSSSRQVLDNLLDSWYTMFVRIPVGFVRRIGDWGVED